MRPDLSDGNKLIEEFFSRYYGAAAGPMRRLYEGIEETFSNPRNYPPEIQTSPGHQHQTEALAWGSLGTEARMAEFGRLMAAARAAARTPEERQRVAMFETGQWQYLEAGRKRYVERAKTRTQEPPKVTAPRVAAGVAPVAGGPATAWIDWSSARDLGAWTTLQGDTTDRKLSARIAHDGTCLYLQFTEELDPAQLAATPQVYDGDDWEVFVGRGAQRRLPPAVRWADRSLHYHGTRRGTG